MSLVLYIFIFYIIISLLGRIGDRKRSSYSIMRKEEDDSISGFSAIQDKAGLPEKKSNTKQVDDTEKKNKIIIDDEVKEYYQKKDKEILTDKSVVKDREEITSDQESGLGIYLSDNILINGIILSEIIAPPRALKPYNFKRYKRLR